MPISNKKNVKQRGGASDIKAQWTGNLQILGPGGVDYTPYLKQAMENLAQTQAVGGPPMAAKQTAQPQQPPQNLGLGVQQQQPQNLGIGVQQPPQNLGIGVQQPPQNQALPNVAQGMQYNLVNQPRAVTQIAQRMPTPDIDLSKVNVFNAPPQAPSFSNPVKAKALVDETVEIFKTSLDSQDEIVRNLFRDEFAPKVNSIQVADIVAVNGVYDQMQGWVGPPPAANPPPFNDFKTAVENLTTNIDKINTALDELPLAAAKRELENLLKLYTNITSYKSTLSLAKISGAVVAQRENSIYEIDKFIKDNLIKKILTQYLRLILEIRKRVYVELYDSNGAGDRYFDLRQAVIDIVFPAGMGGAADDPNRAAAIGDSDARGAIPGALAAFNYIDFNTVNTTISNAEQEAQIQGRALNAALNARNTTVNALRRMTIGDTQGTRTARANLQELSALEQEIADAKNLITPQSKLIPYFIKYLYGNLEKFNTLYNNYNATVAAQTNRRLAVSSIGKRLDEKINEIQTTYAALKQQLDAYLLSANITKNKSLNYLQQIVNLNNSINSIKLDLLKDFITKADDFASHSGTRIDGINNRNTVFDLLKDSLKCYNEVLGNMVIRVYDDNLAAAGAGNPVPSADAARIATLRDDIDAELAREDPTIPQTYIGALRGQPVQQQPPNPKEAARRNDIKQTMIRSLLSIELLKNTTLGVGARVFDTPPILDVAAARNKITGFRGQVAVCNELNTYQEQLIEYYTNLNRQQNVSSPTTNGTPSPLVASQQNQTPPQIPNRLPFAKAKPKRATVSSMLRRTFGFGRPRGGRSWTKKRRYSRRKYRKAKRYSRRRK